MAISKRRFLTLTTVALTVLGSNVAMVARPAAAYVSSVALVNTTNPASGPCPKTLTFLATVNGTKLDPFQYWFRYAINGIETTTAASSPMPMPGTGTIAIPFALSIPSSTNGTSPNYIQLEATQKAGAVLPAESAKLPLSVTCESQLNPNIGPLASASPLAANGLANSAGNALTNVASQLYTVSDIAPLPPKTRGIYRPDSSTYIAGDDIQVMVTGNPPTSDLNGCAYSITPANKVNTGVGTGVIYSWGQHDLDTLQIPGVYSIVFQPRHEPEGGGPASCHSTYKTRTIHVYPQAAFITGLSLTVGGFTIPCINNPYPTCPVVQAAPVIHGTTPGGSCAYQLAETLPAGKQTTEIIYRNGQPAVPSGDAARPFAFLWLFGGSQRVDSSTTTISPANDPAIQNCNITGSNEVSPSISRTIDFTNVPNAPDPNNPNATMVFVN